MSHENDHNDSLERLFKKKADDYDIPYREEDWLKLKNRLDIKDAQRSYNRRIAWLAAASVLLISLLGYFTYDHHKKITQLSGQLSEALSGEALNNPLPDNVVTPERQENFVPENRNENLTDAGDEVDVPTLETTPSEGTDTPLESSERSFTASIDHVETKFDETYTSCLHCEENPPAIQIRKYEQPLLHTAMNERVSYLAKAEMSHAEYEKPSVINASRVSVGIVASPDFSSAGSLANFSSPGYKIGAMVSYQLSSRISLSTGLIQSDVRYRADGNDYNPPPDYWQYGISADEIMARCLILDIPIRMQVEFLQLSRSRFFATAGVSSYIMLNENYRFRYDRDDTDLAQEWDAKTGTRHLFSNSGFSVGYEHDVNPNWSLRVEPFVQVPISQVGWGNVDLYSAGTMVALTYRFQN